MASEAHKTAPNRDRIWAWLREARALAPLPESIGASPRPGIFVLLFWSALAAALATWAFDLFGEGRRVGLVPVSVAAVVLIVAWLLLPWAPRTDARRKLLSLSFFVAAVFALCQMTNILWSLPLYSIAVADGVFLFGLGRGTFLAVATLPLAFASGYIYLPQDARFAGAAFLAGTMVPVAAFVVGICKALLDAEQSRREARTLLRELEEANAELKRQAAKAKELAISEERARIAREVHDSVGHHLTAINLQLQNAERFGQMDPERGRQKIQEARESTLQALAEVRRSVRALKPPALEERSGVAALAALAHAFDGAGPDVSFDLEGEKGTLSEETGLVLYRATQEGLTNAARHSRARRVRVKLAFEPEELRLAVVNDGEGGLEGAMRGGFGLAALRERVEALGGKMAAGNRPEGGFALRIALPRDPSTDQGT